MEFTTALRPALCVSISMFQDDFKKNLNLRSCSTLSLVYNLQCTNHFSEEGIDDKVTTMLDLCIQEEIFYVSI